MQDKIKIFIWFCVGALVFILIYHLDPDCNYETKEGIVKNVDTSWFDVGDKLYINQEDGSIVNLEPNFGVEDYTTKTLITSDISHNWFTTSSLVRGYCITL